MTRQKQRKQVSLAKHVNRLTKRADYFTNVMSQLGASMSGHRYWIDRKGRVRRFSNRPPLLHNGGKPR